MTKKILCLLTLLFVIIMISGCNHDNEVMPINTDSRIQEDTNERSETMKDVVLIINDKEYDVNLYDNETSHDIYDMLPLTMTMSELNGNEKYYYLDHDLTSEAKKVNTIHTGDIKLYGSNCLVLFYKDFNTSYSYTDIGKIEDCSFVNELSDTDINITIAIK